MGCRSLPIDQMEWKFCFVLSVELKVGFRDMEFFSDLPDVVQGGLSGNIDVGLR